MHRTVKVLLPWAAAVLIAVAVAQAQGDAEAPVPPIAHLMGVNDERSDAFVVEVDGPWAVTLSAFCSEGFGYVEATVFAEDGARVGVVTVMGEGVERSVLTAPAGRYYVEVYTSYKNVYDWEVLVEEGEGSEYEYGRPLYAVGHEAHHDAAGHDHDHGASAEVAASIWDGVYTADQAKRGQRVYDLQCSACHGTELVSADGYAPDLVGFRFGVLWHGKTLVERLARIQASMPLGNPGSLSAAEVADIIAYILSQNDYPAGDQELVPGPHLERIEVTADPQ